MSCAVVVLVIQLMQGRTPHVYGCGTSARHGDRGMVRQERSPAPFRVNPNGI
jgi:hypothetical protein